MSKNLPRLLRALWREGLSASYEAPVWRVSIRDSDGPPAEVLLPDDLPVESAALRQLANMAAAQHPTAKPVCKVCASPDFHPGDSGIAIGTVVQTEDMIIPAAVGTDINCGMRLHVADVSLERFLSIKRDFVEGLKGDYFLGTRDVTATANAMRAMFAGGIPGWLLAQQEKPLGLMARADLSQLERELDRIHLGGSLAGDPAWAPEDLVPNEGVVRDGGLGTIGGGNHFVEVQQVEEILDRPQAWAWGVSAGSLAFMIHSGSRNVGKRVGGYWKDQAVASWPRGLRHLPSKIFPLSWRSDPDLANAYLQAEATAANYAFVNRMLLAEMLRQRLRSLLGEVEAPLVYDLPHNISLKEGDRWVARKGACPAHRGQPVIIPGSMGSASYLLVGEGEERWLSSASHGAGRAISRFEMGRIPKDKLGLAGVDCITLKEERRVEEAPAAYKPIASVIAAQVQQGTVRTVAKLRPILTFKA